MVRDALEVNRLLHPDIVVLDEAQRIKNWNTKTAQAIKRLQSRYAFVLTGTPIENRIDEIYSIVDFLDPTVFGPLFRFNREFYQPNDRGRPEEYQNLELLRERIRPLMLRRRKADVETELPARSDRNYFVTLSHQQLETYRNHETVAARLVQIARRRPLTQQEQEKLIRELSMMRMICDTNYILDRDDRTSPKIEELENILAACLAEPETKVVLFSEWERMLELIRERLQRMKIGYAWHTGSVPQKRRRAEIRVFKSDPQCRIFLSTDSGGACEERFPEGQTRSVLLVVVERDTSTRRERLRKGYENLIGNAGDMQLEVADRSTEEAVQRLCEAGILQKRIRATRHLFPESGTESAPLNDEERHRIAGLRERPKRKLKMATILASEELVDEARDALRDAVLFAGCVIAGEARLPEPENLEEVLLSPLAVRWGNNRPLVNGFLTNPAGDLEPVLRGLQILV